VKLKLVIAKKITVINTIVVNEELDRLKNLGWNDPFLDNNITRLTQSNKNSEISFPSEYFDVITEQKFGLWEKQRASDIYTLIKQLDISLLWEVGGGHGGACFELKKLGIETIAIEPLDTGAAILSKNGIKTYCATLEQLKLPDSSIKAIGLFDVLEHIADTDTFLAEIYRILEPDGTLILTVPACQFLFSDYDSGIGHLRRYSKNSLNTELVSAGFIPNVVQYKYAYLLLPVFVFRTVKSRMSFRSKPNKIHKSNLCQREFIDKFSFILRIILRIESIFSLPIGFALLGSYKKPRS
jgi:ubiquinone/menaquinone biosynthesis C-methylase UbiE